MIRKHVGEVACQRATEIYHAINTFKHVYKLSETIKNLQVGKFQKTARKIFFPKTKH